MNLRAKPRLQQKKDLLQKQKMSILPPIPHKEESVNNSSLNKENITFTIQEK
tara:strand:+ start:5015 stop:5170 length:156 start_codon:yes stop_codon:yes gene_type:complete